MEAVDLSELDAGAVEQFHKMKVIFQGCVGLKYLQCLIQRFPSGVRGPFLTEFQGVPS